MDVTNNSLFNSEYTKKLRKQEKKEEQIWGQVMRQFALQLDKIAKQYVD